MVYLLSALALVNLVIIAEITISIVVFHIHQFVWRRRVQRFASEDCCMCGSSMNSHGASSNHGPVSEYDYHMADLRKLKMEWFWRKA